MCKMPIFLYSIPLDEYVEDEYSIDDCIKLQTRADAIKYIEENRKKYAIYEAIQVKASNLIYFNIRRNEGESGAPTIDEYIRAILRATAYCCKDVRYEDMQSYIINYSTTNRAGHWHVYVPGFNVKTSTMERIGIFINKAIDNGEFSKSGYFVDRKVYTADTYNENNLRLLSPSTVKDVFFEEEYEGPLIFAGCTEDSKALEGRDDLFRSIEMFAKNYILEKRVAEKDCMIHAYKTRVSNLEAELSAYRARVSSLGTQVSTYKARASNLEAELNTYKARASRLETELNACKARESRLESDANAYNRRIRRQESDANMYTPRVYEPRREVENTGCTIL